LERHFDRIAASFDGIYSGQKDAVRRFWDRHTRRNIHDRLEQTLRALAHVRGKRVLDVGCGPGRYAVALAAQGAREVVGLDLSARMVEMASSLALAAGFSSQCKFFQQDILQYSAVETYDAVVAQGFFDYVVHPEPVFAKLRSLCRGTLVASFPWKYALRAIPRKLWLRRRGCRIVFFTRPEILHLCESYSFQCKLLQRRGPIFLLIAESRHRQPG
jgi:2-polyprenyl-3-methyl-5-hydroxy-6-metoxy-1,4-benzoquinol methylase